MSYFETHKRGNGEDFTVESDDAPSWVSDAVREAHDGAMPCDWVYATCDAAFDRIADGSLMEDEVDSCADSDTDIYSSRLARWFADMQDTRVLAQAEEDLEDMGGAAGKPIIEQIACLQFCAIARIYGIILAAHTANGDS